MLDPDQNYLPEEEITPPQKKMFLSARKKKIVLFLEIFALIFLLGMIGFYAYYFFKSINQGGNLPPPSPAPTTSIQKPTPRLSKWATDSAFIFEENNLNNLEYELKNQDLNETELVFPPLDFSLNFNEN